MRLFIGFDVGGTHIKHGVIDEDGNELTTDQFDTPEDEESFKQQWREVVEAYQNEHEIAAIGVSIPGHINTHTGEAAKAGALEYLDNVNLYDLFAELTDLPLVAEHCQRVLVLYQGEKVDEMAARDLPTATHPYTRTLWTCRPAAQTYAHTTAPGSSGLSRSAKKAKGCMRWPLPKG